MELNEYQKLSARTLCPYLSMQALGLAGEVGEVIEVLKKHLYHGHDLDKDVLTNELGDVLWYLAAIASTTGISLSTVAEMNVEKLRKRYPNGWDPERSRNRTPTDI